jgi:hypothetical protein
MAAAVFALTVANLINRIEADESLLAPAGFALIMGFYLVITLQQLRDRSPLVRIDASGLSMPEAAPAPIAWDRIRTLELHAGIGGARVDVAVDAETFDQIKLGRRFMGDYIVRRSGWPTGFSILAAALDRKGQLIYAAARNYWPPPESDDDEE